MVKNHRLNFLMTFLSAGLFMLFLSLPICTSVQASVVRIVTNQNQATLYEMKNTTGTSSAIKERSFVVIPEPWNIEINDSESKMFVLEKAGYAPVYIPIFQAPKSNESTIQVELKKLDDATKTQLGSPVIALADQLIDEIIYVQQMLDQGQKAEALSKAQNLYVTHPRSVSVRLIYANALVSVRQFAQANEIYKTLIEELPATKQAMKNSIQAIQSRIQRQPASSTNDTNKNTDKNTDKNTEVNP